MSGKTGQKMESGEGEVGWMDESSGLCGGGKGKCWGGSAHGNRKNAPKNQRRHCQHKKRIGTYPRFCARTGESQFP